MDYERELNTDYSFPNINIYNRISNGEHTGYQAIPYNDYVMYDKTENYTKPKLDENGNVMLDENGNIIEVPVKQYCTLAGFPLNFNFDNFPYVAILKTEADGEII